MSQKDDATSAEAPESRRKRVPPAGEAEKLSPGQRVGSYEIEAEHSRGGFATVYRARHTKIGRTVAIKVLSKFLAGAPEMIKRFENEARAINLIRHPNIVDVTDFGVLEGGRPYFVMEWLEGRDLREELAETGPMPLERVIEIAEDVASALDAAHSADIVHRDLKAANVFALAGDGPVRYKLLDFGVAKILEEESDSASLFVTEQGVRVGTPHAMAPEQIRCQPVSPATDIYSFGVLIYELLSGHPPFHDAGSPQELATRHLRDQPPAITQRKHLGIMVADKVVAKCMAKDPSARYQSAGEVAAALRSSLGQGVLPKGMLRIALAAATLIGVAALAALLLFGPTDSKNKSSQPSTTAHAEDSGALSAEATADGGGVVADAGQAGSSAARPRLDPRRFDLERGLAHARDLANQALGGAKLYRIDVGAPLTAQAGVDLVSQPGSQVAYHFVPAFGAKDACVRAVVFDAAGKPRQHTVSPATSAPCTETAVRAPRCTLARAVKKLAITASIGTKAIAGVRFMQIAGQDAPVWRFADSNGKVHTIPDDC